MSHASYTVSRAAGGPERSAGGGLSIVIIGLAITSSWGNGHATTYRGLVRELSRRGHDVLFLECDQPWYAANRDMPRPPFGRTELYPTTAELKRRFRREVQRADVVIVGSFVHEGVKVGEWVTENATGLTAFYDIDTPVTLAALRRNACEYLSRELVRKYQLYLSFTGGPMLRILERELGAPRAAPLYCAVDPELYFPEARKIVWDLAYLGTYSADRQPAVERLLINPARAATRLRFALAGPQYPREIRWPGNVKRIEHLAPAKHRAFYNAQRFTLNVTRADMIRAGYSPSVRLFEAGACGVPIVSDAWEGLEEFFEPGREIVIARDAGDVLGVLLEMPDAQRRRIGEAARQKVLSQHTAAHRARELERHVFERHSGS